MSDPQQPPSEPRPCPDCGRPNASDATSCSACNFPFDGPARDTSREPDAPAAAPAVPAAAPMKIEPPPRLKRLREKRQGSQQAMTLWLVVAAIGAISLLFFAVRANVERVFPEVEGARTEQQNLANELRTVLETDSTNVDAHVKLGDVLYDTGNWNEAITHYSRAVGLDSSRVAALVDLGVCYYNLGRSDDASHHFRLALARNPHQTVALFNMGILNERAGDLDEALKYFHQALQTDPPEMLRQPVIEAITRVQAASGKVAPPLPEGG